MPEWTPIEKYAARKGVSVRTVRRRVRSGELLAKIVSTTSGVRAMIRERKRSSMLKARSEK